MDFPKIGVPKYRETSYDPVEQKAVFKTNDSDTMKYLVAYA